jgi:hypothetical protein
MTKKYRIKDAGKTKDSHELVDCHIEETDNGYELVAKRVVLASTTSKAPPFTFPVFAYDGWVWTVSVGAASTSQMTGAWSNNNKSEIPVGEEDSWTATGGGTGEDDDKELSADACQ